MSIKYKHKNTRICDLCGKEEFKHLESRDFYKDAPKLIIKNYKGDKIAFQVSVNVTTESNNPVEELLYDVIKSHTIQELSILQLEPVQKIQDIPKNDMIVCKKCYATLIKLVPEYGKFDKLEEF